MLCSEAYCEKTAEDLGKRFSFLDRGHIKAQEKDIKSAKPFRLTYCWRMDVHPYLQFHFMKNILSFWIYQYIIAYCDVAQEFHDCQHWFLYTWDAVLLENNGKQNIADGLVSPKHLALGSLTNGISVHMNWFSVADLLIRHIHALKIWLTRSCLLLPESDGLYVHLLRTLYFQND